METRDIVRWYKKGGILLLILLGLGIILTRIPGLNIMSADKVFDDFMVNPATFMNIFGIGIAALILVFVAYPFVLGFLIEEIDKRVRR